MTIPVLVVAAHPDDEVLGCGATIARHAREGDDVTIAILGEGITSRLANRAAADRALLEELQGRAREAGRLVGAKNVELFGLPDNRFDTIPLLDVVKIVEGLVRRVSPAVVYTHSTGDLNIDHVVTHRAVLTATRPAGECSVREIYAFEVPSSTEWSFGQFETVFRPSVFVDVTSTLEVKIEALKVYESETRSFPHPRSAEALRAIAHARGSAVGLAAAEAFQLIRMVR